MVLEKVSVCRMPTTTPITMPSGARKGVEDTRMGRPVTRDTATVSRVECPARAWVK